MKAKRQELLILFVLGLFTLLVFWPLSTHQFTNVDDEQYILRNSNVIPGLTWSGVIWAFSSGYAANWHPLTWISHMLDCSLYGLNPAGHHLTNLLFHIANTLLVFVLVNGMSGARWRSFFVAAFFGWHPLHVESVAWASERKDVLSTFFLLLTLIAYVRYGRQKSGHCLAGYQFKDLESLDENSPAHGGSSPAMHPPAPLVWYLLSLGFFALGLMSKPMVVTLPFLLLLLDFWPLQRFELAFLRRSPANAESSAPCRQGSNLFYLLREKLPFFLFTLAGCIVTFAVQKKGGAVAAVTLWPRLENAVLSYSGYIGKIFWPAKLAPFYPLPDNFSLALVLVTSFMLVAISVWSVLQARERPYLAVGWFWFLGTLVPTIGLVQVGSQAMADRYTYIPSIGFSLAIIWGVHELVGRAQQLSWFARRPGRKSLELLSAISGAIALIACLICTARQLSYWQNPVKLYGHTIDVTSDNYVAYGYLGVALQGAGKIDEGLSALRTSVRLRPRSTESRYNLGTLLLELGNLEEAVMHLSAAVDLDPRNGNARQNLGDALAKLKRFDEAMPQLAKAIELKTKDANVRCVLGTALWNQSKFEEAVAQFLEATRLNPAYIPAHANLAVALVQLGRRPEAIDQFSEAVRLNPADPELRFNAGLALLEEKRALEAAVHLRAGLELRPDDVRFHYRLAQALALQQRNSEAIAEYRRALDLVPDFQEAASELAKLNQDSL